MAFARDVYAAMERWPQQDILSWNERATLIDSIKYKLPLGVLGELGGGSMVRHRLAQLFHYRHQVMRHDLALHQRFGTERLHFAISGSSGLLGQELCALLD